MNGTMCFARWSDGTEPRMSSLWATARRLVAIGLAVAAMAGCSRSDPGPLSGTWRLQCPIPMTVHFRRGETETMGIIEKASYKVNGNDVIVTTESGPFKGIAVRYTMTDS